MKTHYTTEIRVNGVAVEGAKTEFEGNKKHFEGLAKIFFDYLKSAIQCPKYFKFNGLGGEMNAQEFIAFHEDRLGTDLKGKIELVFDGVVVDRFISE